MTADELSEVFVQIIRRQQWFADLVNKHEDQRDICVAAATGLLGLVVAARALERLAAVWPLNIDEGMTRAPRGVAVMVRTSVLRDAQIAAHAIVESGADSTVELAPSSETAQ